MIFNILILVGAAMFIWSAVSRRRDWEKAKSLGFPIKTEGINDFKLEAERIAAWVTYRRGADLGMKWSTNGYGYLLKSVVYSVTRYAHYAGYYMTVEQKPKEGEPDSDANDPTVFKTDLQKAALHREERKLAKYRRGW